MGTRGFIGFVIDGTEKIAYNHFDSYPAGLGVAVLSWLQAELDKDADGLAGLSLATIRVQARMLRVVEPDSTPTSEDIEALRKYANLGVGTQSVDDWYALIRHTQGNPALMLRAGVIEDAKEFPTDSLFAEWGYVVDLDANVFEAYEGFQNAPHTGGRFADRAPQTEGYYPVRLVASWPLDKLPTADEFVAKLEPAEDES